MKFGKTTNMLLALIVLLLLGNILLPMLKAKDAAAVGEDALSPAAVAERAEVLALNEVANQIGGGLREIAQSNRMMANAIADAIREHARSNERIAYSLDKLTVEMRPAQKEQQEEQQENP
jgi:hypothetical protein